MISGTAYSTGFLGQLDMFAYRSRRISIGWSLASVTVHWHFCQLETEPLEENADGCESDDNVYFTLHPILEFFTCDR
jgi:hypothetical protein